VRRGEADLDTQIQITFSKCTVSGCSRSFDRLRHSCFPLPCCSSARLGRVCSHCPWKEKRLARPFRLPSDFENNDSSLNKTLDSIERQIEARCKSWQKLRSLVCTQRESAFGALRRRNHILSAERTETLHGGYQTFSKENASLFALIQLAWMLFLDYERKTSRETPKTLVGYDGLVGGCWKADGVLSGELGAEVAIIGYV
jgi:hypothetical protein